MKKATSLIVIVVTGLIVIFIMLRIVVWLCERSIDAAIVGKSAEEGLEIPESASGLLAYLGKNDKGHEEYLRLVDKSIMVKIPAGKFYLGYDKENKVQMSEYYIDKYEVTNEKFASFLNEMCPNNKNSFGNVILHTEGTEISHVEGIYVVKNGYEKHPVRNVTWSGAREYAMWAGCDLPTQAQWERAAKVSYLIPYPFGSVPKGENERKYVNSHGGTTKPVYYYPLGQSPYGVFNMVGNVSEWCLDGGETVLSPAVERTNPVFELGPVERGGTCWAKDRYYTSCHMMINMGLSSITVLQGINSHHPRVGFRCAYQKRVDSYDYRPKGKPVLKHLGANKLGYDEYLRETDNMTMVLVPEGEFIFGDGPGHSNARPVKKVLLSSYLIDKHPITVKQFATFLNQLRSDRDEKGHQIFSTRFYYDYGSDKDEPIPHLLRKDDKWIAQEGFENYPAENISWYGAMAYAKWVGLRIPTEAEWERAAKLEEGTKGNLLIYPALPVDYDTHHNPAMKNEKDGICEWCLDFYELLYEVKKTDPCYLVNTGLRVVRNMPKTAWGGGPTVRLQASPERSSSCGIGFRCAMRLEQAK